MTLTEPIDFAELVDKDLGKELSVGPDDRIHCPPDKPISRGNSRCKRVTFLKGYLHCNERSAEIINAIDGVNMNSCENWEDAPNSRMRFKADKQYTRDEYIQILTTLFM